MNQNQSSKQIYQELLENNPTRQHSGGNTKPFAHCLTLQLHDGHQLIFYYLYLVKVEFILHDVTNVLILRFTSDKVTLEGYRLHSLFVQFAYEKPDMIIVQDERYVTAGLIGGPAVINASVEPTSK
jgi:hypothetical protein